MGPTHEDGCSVISSCLPRLRGHDSPSAVADEPSQATGFDLVSAAVGANVAAPMSIVLMATLGMRRPSSRRAASA
jgi:hypothetical protein